MASELPPRSPKTALSTSSRKQKEAALAMHASSSFDDTENQTLDTPSKKGLRGRIMGRRDKSKGPSSRSPSGVRNFFRQRADSEELVQTAPVSPGRSPKHELSSPSPTSAQSNLPQQHDEHATRDAACGSDECEPADACDDSATAHAMSAQNDALRQQLAEALSLVAAAQERNAAVQERDAAAQQREHTLNQNLELATATIAQLQDLLAKGNRTVEQLLQERNKQRRDKSSRGSSDPRRSSSDPRPPRKSSLSNTGHGASSVASGMSAAAGGVGSVSRHGRGGGAEGSVQLQLSRIAAEVRGLRESGCVSGSAFGAAAESPLAASFAAAAAAELSALSAVHAQEMAALRDAVEAARTTAAEAEQRAVNAAQYSESLGEKLTVALNEKAAAVAQYEQHQCLPAVSNSSSSSSAAAAAAAVQHSRAAHEIAETAAAHVVTHQLQLSTSGRYNSSSPPSPERLYSGVNNSSSSISNSASCSPSAGGVSARDMRPSSLVLLPCLSTCTDPHILRRALRSKDAELARLAESWQHAQTELRAVRADRTADATALAAGAVVLAAVEAAAATAAAQHATSAAAYRESVASLQAEISTLRAQLLVLRQALATGATTAAATAGDMTTLAGARCSRRGRALNSTSPSARAAAAAAASSNGLGDSNNVFSGFELQLEVGDCVMSDVMSDVTPSGALSDDDVNGCAAAAGSDNGSPRSVAAVHSKGGEVAVAVAGLLTAESSGIEVNNAALQ
jgi:hypothetical protein